VFQALEDVVVACEVTVDGVLFGVRKFQGQDRKAVIGRGAGEEGLDGLHGLD
jgi:hypothetical protein